MSDSDDEAPPEAVPLGEKKHDVLLETQAADAGETSKEKGKRDDTDNVDVDVDVDDHRRRKEEKDSQPPPPVPVTLITGFLGAGKSTLVRHLLQARHGLRLAVILNEFGAERGLEADLLRSAGAAAAAVPERVVAAASAPAAAAAAAAASAAPIALEDWVELENGCLCCSAKSGFLSAVEALLARTAREQEQEQEQKSSSSDAAAAAAAAATKRPVRPLDGILVETSGLADPGPAATALWADDALESTAALGGVVAVVDAGRLLSQLRARRSKGAINEAERQLAYADVVLVNKVDTLSSKENEGGEKKEEGEKEEQEGGGGGGGERKTATKTTRKTKTATLEEVVAAVRSVNATARVVPCERSAVDPRLLLSVRTVGADDKALERGGAGDDDDDDNGDNVAADDSLVARKLRQREKAPPPSLPAPRHDPGITTISWRFPGVASSEEKLRGWLERVLWRDGGGGGGGGGGVDARESGKREHEGGNNADDDGDEKEEEDEEEGNGEEDELEIFRLKGLVCLPPSSSTSDPGAEATGAAGATGAGGGGSSSSSNEKQKQKQRQRQQRQRRYRKVVVQAVADTYDLLFPPMSSDDNDEKGPEELMARFVAIGRGLKGERGRELVRSFEEEVMMHEK